MWGSTEKRLTAIEDRIRHCEDADSKRKITETEIAATMKEISKTLTYHMDAEEGEMREHKAEMKEIRAAMQSVSESLITIKAEIAAQPAAIREAMNETTIKIMNKSDENYATKADIKSLESKIVIGWIALSSFMAVLAYLWDKIK